jgi:amino acid transporter
MKKLIKIGYTALAMSPVAALAIDVNCPDQLGGACDSDLAGMITMISNTILLLVGVVAVLFLIIGGFQYIASGGNPEQVNKAKNTIFYAIIGIIVALLAYVLVQFVVSQLTA